MALLAVASLKSPSVLAVGILRAKRRGRAVFGGAAALGAGLAEAVDRSVVFGLPRAANADI